MSLKYREEKRKKKCQVKFTITPKRKRKRLGWNEGSELAILDLWPERVEELRKNKKNGHIYAEMANELSKLGYIYSARDVQVKVQNFTQRYRKEKAALDVSGATSSSWNHYDRIHKIIGGFKTYSFIERTAGSICDPTIVSSSSSSSSPITLEPKVLLQQPLVSPSPSPPPNRSASALGPVKKKLVSHFQAKVLQKFDNLSTVIAEHLKKSEENGKELIEIEKKKAASLEKMAKNSEELKNALITLINKK